MIIDEYTPCLKKYFPKGIFKLEVNTDPEIITWKKLIIIVNVDKETYENGCYEHIKKIRRHFWPLRQELDLMSELKLMSKILR